MKTVTLYTDGACSGNPGPGGWAAVLIYKDVKKELSGGEAHTTNNRMEVLAAIRGLEALNQPCKVNIYTDSSYLFNAFDKGWLFNWSKNNWKKADKKPVENQDLWEKLLSVARSHVIKWNKVKGHSDNELNNRCDELARLEIKKLRENAESASDA
ncbi:MAG: ribonuclease HI [Clostridiales bacterium]|nr:ribonuclease HI [Clostridiales bacterium]